MATGSRPQVNTSLVGLVIGGHVVVRELGAGGMGRVYLARHQTLGVDRVIKVIHDDYRTDDTSAARFRREAMVLARLQHPNIVRIVDFGQLDNGWPWLCMDFIDGVDIDIEVESRGPMSLASTIEVLYQLSTALAHAHAQHVVHRDLKPANVILAERDPARPTIIDFGLVRVVSEEMATKLTGAQQMLGSPLYMAPEQAEALQPPTAAADIYALAGMAYTMLSGAPAFKSQSILEAIFAHTQQVAERLSKRCEGLVEIPATLDALIAACLSKDPAQRPSAEELVVHFDRLRVEVKSQSPARVAMGQTGAAMPMADAVAGSFVGRSASTQVPKAVETSSSTIKVEPLSDSQVSGVSAAKLLLGDVGSAEPEFAEALRRQILAVVDEIAARIVGNMKLTQARARATELQSRLDDVGMEAAILEAEGHGQAQLKDKLRALQQDLDAALVEQFELVSGARAYSDASLPPMFDELDDLVGRLQQHLGMRN